MDAERSIKRPKSKGIWVIPVMVLLFGLPYLVSYWWFFVGEVPEASTNNRGILLQEKLAFPTSSLTGVTDPIIDVKSLKGKWILVTFTADACDEQCTENLIQLRQIRRAMGIERNRIERVMVVPVRFDTADLVSIAESFQSLKITSAANSDLQVLRGRLRDQFGALPNSIFIVDPRGNVILGYPAPSNPKDVLKDLQKLLKVSTIG